MRVYLGLNKREILVAIELNLIGYVCPIPVFETKKKLMEMNAGETLILICDDPDVQYDIPKLAKRMSSDIIEINENGGIWEITLSAPNTVIVDDSEFLSEKTEIPADAKLPLKQGDFRIRVFHEEETGFDHVALTLGDMGGPDPTLVRLHSECLTGDAFGSLRCDCGPQLESAIDTIKSNGWGCLLYLRQEGRGIGLHSKIQAYNLQDKGLDTLEANIKLGLPGDARDYKLAASMLKTIGVQEVCLLTNNPDKVEQLKKYNVDVVERMPLVVGVGEHNRKYLETKVIKMGHEISKEKLNGN